MVTRSWSRSVSPGSSPTGSAADDRTYDMLTVRDRHIVAIRACRDRAEALAIAGTT